MKNRYSSLFAYCTQALQLSEDAAYNRIRAVRVAAKWPDGRTEDIKRFKSESEANTWIVDELDRWLKARKEGHASET